PKGRKKQEGQPKLWQLLTKHLLGFSPLMAREAVYRTIGDAESLVEGNEELLEGLAWNIRELVGLYDTHKWQPQLVERVITENAAASLERSFPIAAAAYVLEQYAKVPEVRIRQSPSMNVLLDEYYARSEWRD